MFFVKSEDKRKNWFSYIALALLLSSGVMLDINQSRENQLTDCSCSCLEQTQSHNEAGWLFGNHCKGGVRKFRLFGITVRDNMGCCYKK
jgi:hypothetical protein